MQLGAGQVQISIFTFKEGFLARLAHDLEFRLRKCELSVEGLEGDSPVIKGKFFPASLEVVECKPSDRAEIENNAREVVLKASRFSEITFESTEVEREGNAYQIRGALTICGKTAPVSTMALRERGMWVADLELRQSDFGIEPFSALGGMMKVKDLIRIHVAVQLN